MAQVIVNTNEFYEKKSFKNTVIMKDTPLLKEVQNQQNKKKPKNKNKPHGFDSSVCLNKWHNFKYITTKTTLYRSVNN